MVKKPCGILAFIGKSIENRSWDIIMHLYKSLVRPHLGVLCAVLVRSRRKDVVKLERVQKRFTRMLPGLEGLR